MDNQEAKKYYEEAIEFSENNSIKEAIESIKKALDLSPEDKNYWARLSVFYQRSGEYEDALSCVEKAIELSSEEASLHHLKSDIFVKLKEYDKAMESLDEAIRIEPNNELYKQLRAVVSKMGGLNAGGITLSGWVAIIAFMLAVSFLVR